MKKLRRKCRICKTPIETTDKRVWWCEDHPYEYAKLVKKKAHAKKRKEYNENDPKWLREKLQIEVNAIARLIDRGLPCLATGNGGQIHGGHVFSRGGHTQMRYNLHNIHRQSAASNNKQSHDGLMQEKLAQEYGDRYLGYLKFLRGYPPVKKSVPELQECLKRAREVRGLLKKRMDLIYAPPIDKQTRIELRNQANDYIGYYEANYTY